MIVGSNTAESHPVLATRVKRAHKLRGQKLIVADLREHEMRNVRMFSSAETGHRSRLAMRREPLSAGSWPGENRVPQPVGQRSRRYKKSLAPYTMELPR